MSANVTATSTTTDTWWTVWSAPTNCPRFTPVYEILTDPALSPGNLITLNQLWQDFYTRTRSTISCSPPGDLYVEPGGHTNFRYHAPNPTQCPIGWSRVGDLTLSGNGSTIFNCCSTGWDYKTTVVPLRGTAVAWEMCVTPTLTGRKQKTDAATAIAYPVTVTWTSFPDPTRPDLNSAIPSATGVATSSGSMLPQNETTPVLLPGQKHSGKLSAGGIAGICLLLLLLLLAGAAYLWFLRRRRRRPRNFMPELCSEPTKRVELEARCIVIPQGAECGPIELPVVPPTPAPRYTRTPTVSQRSRSKASTQRSKSKTSSQRSKSQTSQWRMFIHPDPKDSVAYSAKSFDRFIIHVDKGSKNSEDSNPSGESGEIEEEEEPESKWFSDNEIVESPARATERTNSEDDLLPAAPSRSSIIKESPPKVLQKRKSYGIVDLELRWLEEEEARIRERRERLLAARNSKK